jgi:ubiquinone/menaquinone biosynthesis C-methylase UbiE
MSPGRVRIGLRAFSQLGAFGLTPRCLLDTFAASTSYRSHLRRGYVMSTPPYATLNDQVRDYWEQDPCGTVEGIVGKASRGTHEFYERVESHRYSVEPFIHSVAQFTRYHGRKILEIGVGAGTDHLQWARAGAVCHGVDLTDAAIEMTRERLALYGFDSQLQRADAERVPFEDEIFDLVYSWGVIHHSERPSKIIEQIHRVLKKSGRFVGMMYGRRSVVGLQFWARYALLAGCPWRSFHDVIWHHMESIGTKAYTPRELRALFSSFSECQIKPILTPYDKRYLPNWLTQFLPNRFGWFLTIDARK